MDGNRIIAIPMKLQWGSAMKLVYTITWRGNSQELTSEEFTVNNLVMIRFRWVTSLSENNVKLNCSFSSKRLDNPDILKEGKGTAIKMDLRSDNLDFSQQGICPTECWSDWQSITKALALPLKNTHIYYTACVFYISAYKITIDTLSSKLYADADFTDFHLSTDEGSVAVHKACLATRSDVFKAMLFGEWKEIKEGKIKLEGVTLKTLQHLKTYLYLGTLPDEGLRSLLLVARCYMIDDLMEQCIRQLAQMATGSDLYSLHEFACENNIPELTFATLQLTQSSAISYADGIRQIGKLNSV